MFGGDLLSLCMMFVSGRTKFIVLITACVLFYVICDPYDRRKKKKIRFPRLKRRGNQSYQVEKMKLSCDCHERIGVNISSLDVFEEMKAFFTGQVTAGIFEEIPVKKPYQNYGTIRHWYRCRACGCLWEMVEPDFPAKGRVRKFADGQYFDEEEELIEELKRKGKLARRTK